MKIKLNYTFDQGSYSIDREAIFYDSNSMSGSESNLFWGSGSLHFPVTSSINKGKYLRRIEHTFFAKEFNNSGIPLYDMLKMSTITITSQSLEEI
jgi:hypothetical protein